MGRICFALAALGPLAVGMPAAADVISFSGATTTYTVPTTGVYEIMAYGAEGGSSGLVAGGAGAEVGAYFSLPSGETLSILVGGGGLNGGSVHSGTGGGGTFVIAPGNTALLVAGGGGGAGIGPHNNGSLAGIGGAGTSGGSGYNNDGALGGTGGQGGGGSWASGGGTGLLSNGSDSQTVGGASALGGGLGTGMFGRGLPGSISFGGGGSLDSYFGAGGGGGGGYSGGGGGGTFSGGGGGGSFIGGLAQTTGQFLAAGGAGVAPYTQSPLNGQVAILFPAPPPTTPTAPVLPGPPVPVTQCPAYSQTPGRPIAPGYNIGTFCYPIPASGGASGSWYDPPTASGYAYEMTDTSLFTSILDFPPGFLGSFQVTTPRCTIPGTYGPGQSVNFVALCGAGVSSFAVTGIDPAFDPTNTSAFPIQLAFDTPTASFDAEPLVSTTTDAPEPPAVAMIASGLAVLTGLRRRGRRGLAIPLPFAQAG
jgi:hypothetical protein